VPRQTVQADRHAGTSTSKQRDSYESRDFLRKNLILESVPDKDDPRGEQVERRWRHISPLHVAYQLGQTKLPFYGEQEKCIIGKILLNRNLYLFIP
jgi:hypothetical protein